MSRGTWCWLVCPFSRPRLAPAPSAAPPGGTEVHPTTFFWAFLFFFFFHLYPWCSCFKISLEQNMKGVVIPIVSSSLPGKLPPCPAHIRTHLQMYTHGGLRAPQDGSAGGRALLGWSEAGQPELGRNGQQLGKAGLIGGGL